MNDAINLCRNTPQSLRLNTRTNVQKEMDEFKLKMGEERRRPSGVGWGRGGGSQSKNGRRSGRRDDQLSTIHNSLPCALSCESCLQTTPSLNNKKIVETNLTAKKK